MSARLLLTASISGLAVAAACGGRTSPYEDHDRLRSDGGPHRPDASDGGRRGPDAGGDGPRGEGPDAEALDGGSAGPLWDCLDRGVELCSEHGWCWQSPFPHGYDVAAVWGSAPNDVWFVGSRGVVTRWNGERFESAVCPDIRSFGDVWGSGPEDVWLTGTASSGSPVGRVLRFDGRVWREARRVGAWPRLAGSGPDDVWVATSSDPGVVLDQWDGRGWSDRSPPAARRTALWALSPTDVWLGGSLANRDVSLWRWNGVRWDWTWSADAPLCGRSGGLSSIVSFFGATPNDVWAFGYDCCMGSWDCHSTDPFLLRWDGSAWSESWRGGEEADFGASALFGFSSVDIWAGTSLRFDGSSWSQLGAESTSDLWGAGPDDLWALRENGSVLRWDGVSWHEVEPSSPQIADLWLSPGGLLWAVAEGAVLLWSGHRWDERWEGSGSLTAISGAADDDAWAVGCSSGRAVTLHFDGERWDEVDNDAPGCPADVWAASDDAVWLVGDGGVSYWDGGRWLTSSGPGLDGLLSVWGFSSRDVWAVGEAGSIFHWDGEDWSGVPAPEAGDLRSVWGSAPTDVWAVGSGASGGQAILHWEGAEWAAETSLDHEPLSAVVGLSEREVWAVGDDGAVLRWWGWRWGREESGTSHDLRSVHVAGPGEVWAVGERRTVLTRRSSEM